MSKDKTYLYNEHDENQVNKILKQKKKKKLKRNLKILFYLLVLTAIIAFFVSDLSKVKSIEIEGNKDIKSKEILDTMSINDETIYLFIDKKDLSEKIKAIPMVKKVNVSIDLMGNVFVDIEECEKVAYCEIGSDTYIIDELGGVRLTEDKSVIQALHSCPRILNFKNLEFLETFAKEYVQLPELIKNQTSDIVYSPKKADETRLEFILDNGKSLFLRVEDMVDQLMRFDFEANMTEYSDRCIFSFEGDYIYTQECEQ